MAPIRHVPQDAAASLSLAALPSSHWEHVVPPLRDASGRQLHTAFSVYGWWATTPDGPALHSGLRTRAHGVLPTETWRLRFYTHDLRAQLRPFVGQVLFLRVASLGVAEQAHPFLITP